MSRWAERGGVPASQCFSVLRASSFSSVSCRPQPSKETPFPACGSHFYAVLDGHGGVSVRVVAVTMSLPFPRWRVITRSSIDSCVAGAVGVWTGGGVCSGATAQLRVRRSSWCRR